MNAPQSTSAPITILYDAACPFCHYGVTRYRADAAQGEACLLNGREASAFKAEALQRGLNIDQGIVLKQNGVFYHGSAAVSRMALTCERKGFYNQLLYYTFRSQKRSRMLYPLFKCVRRVALFVKGKSLIHVEDAKRQGSTIRRQLGSEWAKLHPAIQQRFVKEPDELGHVFYRGTMQRIERSRAGKWFALLTTCIGNPLTPFDGEDVRMDVLLHRRLGHPGVYWRRTYYYPGRRPYTVTSVKCESGKGEMLECVGGGFGMALTVYVDRGNLHFRSRRYFWRVGNIRIPLPHILSPGQTHVAHEEIGEGRFRFTITMDHPYLGRTFYQTGIFREER